ncbi:TrkH family potassium uptake protein [Bailinhaonella thermotolerans]|uniref:TrkH family potassium uptake protein n=1 Tax=Bailinhaonella thermotolerans TaxID=1070861 RepID=A0A3A4AVT9_9ACTN|nr:potassium transporter TrkG [Bailinhaonella thermotolerans]RJL29993.1 TrkH family potassium uptake protein [Bailinhaonella thermotolerans]
MRRPWGRALLDRFQHPAQVIVSGFGSAILAGTGLLASPMATSSGEPAEFLVALFTATSAVCLTGLVLVDTADHWSLFGELVIMALMQVGGLGIMTLATLFTVLLAGRLGLRARLFVQAETKTPRAADLRRVVRNVVLFSLAAELVLAVILAARFALAYGEAPGRAAYLGIFHSISSFNNAGFALWPDSVIRFATDPWIILTLTAGVILGGIGFPVVFELARSWRRPRTWSVLTRITLTVSAVLLTLGTMIFLATEWTNPRTLGGMDDPGKFLTSFFLSAMTRSGGFNSVNMDELRPSSLLLCELLMFIGGGSAGTAGGIKVTTFGVLLFMVWSELRGEPRVNAWHRRLPSPTQRQAVTITLMSIVLIAFSTYLLLVLTPHNLDFVLFEAVSAATTNGMSTGITPESTVAGQILLILLMFVGRTGPLTLGSALALRERTRRYELPEERVIVG